MHTRYFLKLVGALLILLATCINVRAQEIRSRTGFGYYNPQIGGDTGNIFYTDVTFKLRTGFFVGAGFGFSDVFTSYGDEVPLFEGFRSIRNYYHFRLMIDKELSLNKSNRHIVTVGTGLTYIELRFAEPFVFINPNTGDILIGINESDRQQDDIGFLVHADYGYKVGKFTFGVRSEIHLLFDVGLGGVIISPQISIGF